MRRKIDYSLYLVAGSENTEGERLEKVLSKAVKGGVSVVQLREKNASTGDFLETARRALAVLRPLGVPLIINDRADIALASGADGLHIGQSDLPFDDARRLMGPGAVIGLSVESVEDAVEAQQMDLDYLGISPVFLTPTKKDTAPALGLEGIKKIRSLSRHPLVAIGGINIDNAEAVVNAGADGIAVISAICASGSPEVAAMRLLERIRRNK